MAKWHPNSNKHKAAHGGYREKPTQKDVKALLSLYGSLSTIEKTIIVPTKKQVGAQLKLEL